MKIELFQGDCLELMKDIPDGSVDMVLADLPYGTTKNKWDKTIPLNPLWEAYKRIIKRSGAIVLFSQSPFDKILGASAIELLKYEWIWDKALPTGAMNSRFAPLKKHENILVFSKSAACFVKNKDKAMTYNPQIVDGKPYKAKIHSGISSNYDVKWQRESRTDNSGTRYPTSILKFSRDWTGFHPTQKPVALLEYLIRTYTNAGETVLDNTMGSGSTGVACVNTGRSFIGIELDPGYFETAKRRIEEAQEQANQPNLFKEAGA